jgi:hypothetical protein
MTDAIDVLNERDDVAKTEYTRHKADTNDQVTIELWHDTESLQRIAERAMTGVRSQKGMQKLAEDEAIAVRETRIDTFTGIDALYPDIVECLKEEIDKSEDYEYNRRDW